MGINIEAALLKMGKNRKANIKKCFRCFIRPNITNGKQCREIVWPYP
jgi:hypothetical protein